MGDLSVDALINRLAIFWNDGGSFMWAIMIVWGFGIAVALERFLKLAFKFDVDGPSFMNEIQRYILSNDVQGAIRTCSGTQAMLPRVLKSGLKRAAQSVEQIQNAIDATALEVIPRIEQRLTYLNLVSNISTLIGLLGTIQGLIESFAAVAAADPTQKSELLTMGISKAMNTTYLGLVSAISMMVIHTYLSAKSDKIVNEIDEYSVKLLDFLGTSKQKPRKA
ncbi:MotA/TolQ/ExbB proton channel family protein [Bacteriovoracales bacterium]|nr:MotA/TolQ/ExbB proton channel family protein [Bacteriovoracales bacterium]